MRVKYYFIVENKIMIDDLVKFTGISISNLWYEFFLNIFNKHCKEINDFAELVKIIGYNRAIVIRILNEYKIDGLSFVGMKAFQFEINNPIFDHISFKLIKSRRIIVINDNEFNTM